MFTVSKSPEAHPTKIYQWTDQIMQIQEQRMYVICRATQGKSELPPAITWKLGDRELTETDNIKVCDADIKTTLLIKTLLFNYLN